MSIKISLPNLDNLETDFLAAHIVARKSKDHLLATMLYRTALDIHAVKAMLEIRKVKNQPPDLTAGEFNRGE